MRYKVKLNPLRYITLRGSGVQNWQERCKEAFYSCPTIKEFTDFVKREFNNYGFGTPIDVDKPFPQVHGADFFGGKIRVGLYLNAEKKEGEMRYTYKDLAEELYYCIDNDLI